MRRNLDWAPFYEVAALDLPFDDKLERYAAIADRHFDTARFEEFCEEHLARLDEVAYEFFGSDVARDAVHRKVKAMFPEHEVEKFTEHFWGMIQFWRKTEADRMGGAG
jgi:hypothetical protein